MNVHVDPSLVDMTRAMARSVGLSYVVPYVAFLAIPRDKKEWHQQGQLCELKQFEVLLESDKLGVGENDDAQIPLSHRNWSSFVAEVVPLVLRQKVQSIFLYI